MSDNSEHTIFQLCTSVTLPCAKYYIHSHVRDISYLAYPSVRLTHILDFLSSNYREECIASITPIIGSFNHASPSPSACWEILHTTLYPIIIHHGIRSHSATPRTVSVLRHNFSRSGPSVRSWALGCFNFFRGWDGEPGCGSPVVGNSL
jgi:hypothetical protein